jgi:hypothetical protein
LGGCFNQSFRQVFDIVHNFVLVHKYKKES